MAGDLFRILGIPRGLEWCGETMRAQYDRRCREAHPDQGGDTASFEELREAYAELSSPGKRLRHWLELGGAVPEENGALPAQAMAHFAELGPLLQRANEIAERHRGARSVLARSLAEREGLALLPRLESARRETQAQIGALEGRFPELERRGPCEAGSEAMEILHSLLFLEKWEGQLQEAWGRLGCW